MLDVLHAISDMNCRNSWRGGSHEMKELGLSITLLLGVMLHQLTRARYLGQVSTYV